MSEDRKEELLKQNLSEEELEGVSGGDCWNSARFVAPDGHDVGCKSGFTWYADIDKTKFSRENRKICWADGKAHNAAGRQYAGNGLYRVYCTKCHQFVDVRTGYWDSDTCFVDGDGNFVKMLYEGITISR